MWRPEPESDGSESREVSLAVFQFRDVGMSRSFLGKNQ
jgi:hypothetical protein